MYKAREFAGRGGVTVRTLHHYELDGKVLLGGGETRSQQPSTAGASRPKKVLTHGRRSLPTSKPPSARK